MTFSRTYGRRLPWGVTAIAIDPQLARALFWIAVACCAVAQVAIVRSALRPHEDDGAAGPVPRPVRAWEVLWALIPAAALAAALALTWQALDRFGGGFDQPTRRGAEAVVGHAVAAAARSDAAAADVRSGRS